MDQKEKKKKKALPVLFKLPEQKGFPPHEDMCSHL